MCGINLIFGYGADAPPVDETELFAVRESMMARGPDEAGVWRSGDGRLGLAHRRLSIIDLSPTGRQPMSLPGIRDSPVIVFNGEIYNYRELRRILEGAGSEFHSNSDTEVLLHLYRREGAEMVKRLRGMFAFAIWDPARRGVLLARDHFGIKPLYYANDGHTLRAASQVRALMAGGGVDRMPDPAGHVGFYLLGYVPEPHTLYRGVSALPAGATLWCDANGPGEPIVSSVELALDRQGLELDTLRSRPKRTSRRARHEAPATTLEERRADSSFERLDPSSHRRCMDGQAAGDSTARVRGSGALRIA